MCSYFHNSFENSDGLFGTIRRRSFALSFVRENGLSPRSNNVLEEKVKGKESGVYFFGVIDGIQSCLLCNYSFLLSLAKASAPRL